jgi:integrase
MSAFVHPHPPFLGVSLLVKYTYDLLHTPIALLGGNMPKKIKSLSAVAVKDAKPKIKQYALFDGDGLFLLVTPSGGKLWRMKYRINGKEKYLAFGAYPEISLADARERRGDARKSVAHGVDPAEIRKAQKASKENAAADSFEVVAREWHSSHVKAKTWVTSHAEHKLARLEKDLFAWIGQRPISEIETPELLAQLQRVVDRGALDAAHRLRFDCQKIFAYAIATGRAKCNPARDLVGILAPVKNNHYPAPTDPKILGPMLIDMDNYVGSYIVRAALRLTPLLMLRPGELRMAEWAEFDLPAALWNIPGPRMKMKEPIIVPLSRQSLKIIKELQPLTCYSKYVFPSPRTGKRCICDGAVNAALKRMGYTKEQIVAHGFRATAKTMQDEVLGIPKDWTEHQLSHAVIDANGRAYNRTTYLPQRIKMMQDWADYLDSLKVR